MYECSDVAQRARTTTPTTIAYIFADKLRVRWCVHAGGGIGIGVIVLQNAHVAHYAVEVVACTCVVYVFVALQAAGAPIRWASSGCVGEETSNVAFGDVFVFLLANMCARLLVFVCMCVMVGRGAPGVATGAYVHANEEPVLQLNVFSACNIFQAPSTVGVFVVGRCRVFF